jgi:hypothetical protein
MGGVLEPPSLSPSPLSQGGIASVSAHCRRRGRHEVSYDGFLCLEGGGMRRTQQKQENTLNNKGLFTPCVRGNYIDIPHSLALPNSLNRNIPVLLGVTD